MAVTQLGYLGIGVSDLNAWTEYATNVLGLEVAAREEDGSMRLRMDQYSYRFILHPSGEDDLVFTGWEVKDEEHLREVTERLRADGVEVTEGTPEEHKARDVIGMVKCVDPAGLSTEIFYGPHLEKVRPFNSPRGITGFQTGENGNMGLGHIVVGVPDLASCMHFYRDLLGLRISDYIDLSFGPMEMRVAFFHANARHHSIAFGGPLNPGAGPATLGGAGRKRLNHFMLELNSIDDVGITYDLIGEKGIHAGKLGRHTNDHMFSFYMQTPSGFNVEYGWGGRWVDDNKWEVQYYKDASIWGHGFMPPPQQPATASAGATS
jgi:2,3-dihydroxybiphenyl 1,2-dioxygenase